MAQWLVIETATRGGAAWWVAPSYPMAALAWRSLKRTLADVWTAKLETDRRIDMPGGGYVAVKSADRPDSLRGAGLDYAVLDECAFMSEEAWTEAIRPSLADHQGGAMFISTPKGRNWFWQLYQRGLDPDATEWASWTFPTTANPHIEPAEVEAARAGLPERIYRQEFLAEFLDQEGAVFRRVQEAATGEPTGPVEGHSYAIGVDWGKQEDFTVCVVLDLDERRVVHLDRQRRVDYVLQSERLRALCERYAPGVVVAERNSMGEPIIEQLRRMNLPVQPFTTTNATKAQIVEGLALALERGDLTLLNDPVLVGELLAFEATKLPSGLLRYAAPEGQHDDTVMALALAWSAASRALTGPVGFTASS